MIRPLVAVPTYRLDEGRVRGWTGAGFGVPERYVASLSRAGAQAVLLPGYDPTLGAAALDAFAGLLLIGGGDVDPARYGEPAHPSVYGVDAGRDGLELRLVEAAVEYDVPTLAICRGFQVLNVALGGTLHQHLPDLEDWSVHGSPMSEPAVLHEVKLDPTSRTAAACGVDVVNAASHHHQGVDRLGAGLRATAWTDDGLIEGIEVEGADWIVGVQWHPEMTAVDDPEQQALFDAFVAQL